MQNPRSSASSPSLSRYVSSRLFGRPTSAFAALLLVAQVVACGWAGGKVGEFLAPIREEVDAVIEEASAEGQTMLVTAASQVDLVVSNAESTFAADLNKSISQLDDASRRWLNQIESLVSNLGSDSTALVNSTIDGSQQMINSIPFMNRNPQVRRYSPHFSSAGVTDTVTVTLDGNFVYSSERGLSPQMELNGRTFSAQVQTSQLAFLLPADLFHDSPNEMTRLIATVTIPYEKGAVFKSIRPGVFNIIIIVLPARPVSELTVVNEKTTTGTESRTQVVPPGASDDGNAWRVSSVDSCKPADDAHTVSATDGWRIDPASVTIIYQKRGYAPRGWASLATSGPTGFTVEAHTKPSCFAGITYNSGDITYYVTYTETREVSYRENQTVDLLNALSTPLKWGDSAVVPVTKGKWKVHAKLWDGTIFGTAHDTNSNPYLTIRDDGDAITIAVTSTDKIVALP